MRLRSPTPATTVLRTLLLGLALGVPACRQIRPASTPAASAQGRLYEASELRKFNARTAWDLLQRTNTMLRLSDAPGGRAGSVRGRRGQSSFYLASDIPLLLLDGVRVAEFGTLRSIDASLVQSIRIVGPRAATAVYGSDAGAGAVEISTAPPKPGS